MMTGGFGVCGNVSSKITTLFRPRAPSCRSDAIASGGDICFLVAQRQRQWSLGYLRGHLTEREGRRIADGGEVVILAGSVDRR